MCKCLPLLYICVILLPMHVYMCRNCIGQQFAMNEMKVAVAKILRRLAFMFLYSYVHTCTSVEIGSGHPGQLGHIFSGSSGSDPVYKLSRSDPDWIT